MAKPIYTYPADEVGTSATVTLTTGTADANYPVTNVQDRNPGTVFLTSSTATAVDILWDHGSATDVKVFSLHHHNIPAGTDVRIQRNAANSWGGPTMDVAVTVATYPNTGLPLPFAIDLTAQVGYSGAGFRYTRLHVPSLSQKVGVGSALLWSAKRQDLRGLRFPIRPSERQAGRVWPTAYGVKSRYRLGVRLRQIEGVIRNTNADFSTWLAWFRAAQGNVQPFLYWLDPSGSDGWLAAFEQDVADVEYAEFNVSPARVVIEEVSNSVAIPTS